MQENTNKAIAVNSIINYAKMGINTILALLTTRFALQALGVNDFGLFSVLGSIITFIGIFNVIMLPTSNRFLAVAIGKGDIMEVNKQFNAMLSIFLSIAVFLSVIALPIGFWYVNNFINYDGPIENAIMVFTFSIVGSIISTVGTPYNGLLMAKERFWVFSLIEVISHFVRFVCSVLLLYYFENKLLVYTSTMALMTAMPTFVYWIYCRCKFPDYVAFNIVRDISTYKEIFSFSGWIAYGAIACVARNQGAALLVNAFFNTVMNTALGIANMLIAYVQIFANNVTQPMQPQITKSYAAGNYSRTNDLLVMSTKFSFLLMLIVSTPFFTSGEWLLSLWLDNVPPYVYSFTILLIIDSLVTSFNSGLSVLLFASGNIAFYQVLINTLRLISIGAAYFVLKEGCPPEMLFVTYIVFSIFIIFATQYCLYRTLNFNSSFLIKKSYLPSLSVAALAIPVFLVHIDIHPALLMIGSMTYLFSIIYALGLSKEEKINIKKITKKIVKL